MARKRIPAGVDARKVCPSCGERRGNKKAGWNPIHLGGELIGYSCPDCPHWDEPITRRGPGFSSALLVPTADGKKRQVRRTFPTLEAARSWVEEVRAGATDAERRGISYRDPSRMTVRELADAYLKHREAQIGTPGGPRESTVSGYRSALSSLLVHIGDRVARDLSADDIEDVLRKLATDGGRGGRALSHRLSLIHI